MYFFVYVILKRSYSVCHKMLPYMVVIRRMGWFTCWRQLTVPESIQEHEHTRACALSEHKEKLIFYL